MASSRRTYDTDFLTLRTIYAKYADNSTIPALRALTADGRGGTTWLQPSSFGTNPSFNQIITTGGTYTADLSFNTFRLFAGDGVGMANGSPGSNETYIYSKTFNQIDIKGGDSLKSFSNEIFTPRVKFATGQNSYIQLHTDSDTNTLFIDGPMTQTISTGYYGFNKFVVIPTVSSIQTNLSGYPKNTLFADSQSTQITFAGVGDILLSTNYSNNQVFFSVSSFTAAGYLALSGETFSVYNRLFSTISSSFLTVANFSTGAISLSTNSFSNASSVNSSILGISSYFATKFDVLTGLINARVTIVQLNDTRANFQTALSSFSTNYVSYSDYTSSATGILNQVSTTLYLSSISSVYLYGGSLVNFSAGTIFFDQNDVSTLSTATNSRIISTTNTLIQDFTLINNGNLRSTFSTVIGLGTLGYVSSSQLISTVTGLGTLGFISSTQLTSTTQGLGTLGYVSTSYSDNLLRSTVKGINDNLGSYGYISTQSFTSSLQSTTHGIVNSLGSLGYLSTQSLESTVQGVYDSFGEVYLRTDSFNSILNSSIAALGQLGYVSTPTLDLALKSSFDALFQYNLISTPNLVSTVNHLGSMGFISTASLTSSLIGTELKLLNIRSSFIYSGNMGNTSMTIINNDELYFSSANFSLIPFSNYIQTISQVSFDANVNLFFTSTTQARYSLYELSTFLQCEGSTVSRTTYSDVFFAGATYSNMYSKLITMNIDTDFIRNNYMKNYAIAHKLKGTVHTSVDAFPGKDVSIYMASTNSLFLSIVKSQGDVCTVIQNGGGGIT